MGTRPPLPPRLADLYERPERFSLVAPELGAVQDFVRRHARRNLA
jgi:threonine synthase